MSKAQKRSIQKLFLIVTIPVISLCATFILLYVFIPLDKKLPITPPQAAFPTVLTPMSADNPDTSTAIVSEPAKIKINSINVEALVSPVGINSLGDMDIDENPTQLAWYKLGPKPGEQGSAVIAGHYGWKNGVPSVFNDLNKLKVGDTVSTYDQDGQLKTFKVTRTAMYAPDQDATDVFRSSDGGAHLNLVTCQGSWNNTAKTYSERLVVFTDLIK